MKEMSQARHDEIVDLFGERNEAGEINMGNVESFFAIRGIPCLLGVCDGAGACVPIGQCVVAIHTNSPSIEKRRYVTLTVHYHTQSTTFGIPKDYAPINKKAEGTTTIPPAINIERTCDFNHESQRKEGRRHCISCGRLLQVAIPADVSCENCGERMEEGPSACEGCPANDK